MTSPAANTSRSRVLKVRYVRTSLVPLAFATLAALPLVLSFAPWGLFAMLAPIFVAYLIWRVGANISTDRIVIQGPFYSRTVNRRTLAGIGVTKGGGVFLIRTDGSSIMMPTARARDLPRLRGVLFPEQ